MIEFAQAQGIDDRRAALQRRVLPGARSQNAAKQNKDCDQNSHVRPVSRTNAAHQRRQVDGVLRAAFSIQEISRKADGLSRRSRHSKSIASRRSEAMMSQRVMIKPLLVTTTQRPSWRLMASTRPRPGIGSPAYTSNIPRRPSISAAPLATSRSTQPSTVGSLATSGLGAAAGAADAGGEIEPGTSFAAPAVAAGADATHGAARSLSTTSLSFARFAARSAFGLPNLFT